MCMGVVVGGRAVSHWAMRWNTSRPTVHKRNDGTLCSSLPSRYFLFLLPVRMYEIRQLTH